MANLNVTGFSKWSKERKTDWLLSHFLSEHPKAAFIEDFRYKNEIQKVLDGFSENTISNFPMPFGLAPHFLIDRKEYVLPMVIEESSVVAAASSAAKFWKTRGGFSTEILDTKKVGQVHFTSSLSVEKLKDLLQAFKPFLREKLRATTQNMEARGGGLLDIHISAIQPLRDTYQLFFEFNTCDSMGANFINTVLEEAANYWKHWCMDIHQHQLTIVMCILSNYTPDCIVRASASCPIKDLGEFPGNMTSQEFANKFKLAVDIATHDPYRACTHNKGIFNGIDALILATGNDFRAVEAAGHTHASKQGKYQSLSSCDIKNGNFHFELEIPLSIGTVGGLTKLHPMADLSLAILGNPSASELMSMVAALGLAQNFAAVRSLITTGIQKGHMKMHLYNILSHFEATEKERSKAYIYFTNKIVSFGAVRNYINLLRQSEAIKKS